MKKLLAIMVTLLITVQIVWATNLTIESDKQTVNVDENIGHLDGNVKVKVDDITINGQRAELYLDPKTKKMTDGAFYDKAYALQIRGNKKNELKANILKMSLLNKTVTAIGSSQTVVYEKGTPTVIINADTQEYNTEKRVMKASGGVIVRYKDAETFSNEGIAHLDSKNDLDKLFLIGNAKLRQNKNLIEGPRFEYSPKTEIAIVSGGNTHSDIINEEKGDRIQVWAGYQQYDKKHNTIIASNNVRIKYKDFDAQGPKATVIPDKATNKLNEIIFVGRSKITNEGRTVEADRIILTMNPKNFFAEGRVKTSIPNVQSSEEAFKGGK